MTVPSNINKHIYEGNGVATLFPYSFPLQGTTDMEVWIIDPTTGTETKLTANYRIIPTEGSFPSVSGNVEYPGWETGTEPPVELRPPTLPDDWQIILYRYIEPVQEMQMPNSGTAFYPKVWEKALDRVVMMIQQLSETLSRSIQLPKSSDGGGESLLASILSSVASALNAATTAQTAATTASGYADDAEQAKEEAEAAAVSVQGYIDHVSDTDNPHNTTAEQVGAYTKEETDAVINNTSVLPGVENYIGEGLEVFPGVGLNIVSSAGRAVISEKLVSAVQQGLLLDARMVSLVCLNADGTIGKVNAHFPAADVNTICRWIVDGSASIANSAVGNGLAVANNLAKNGTVAQVDGWIDQAARGDGSTGYYVSQNSTGFPIGAAERQIDILVTPLTVAAGDKCIVSLGTGNATNNYSCSIYASGANIKLYFADNNYIDTGYTVEVGKTYLISLCYDGSTIKTFIDGSLVYSITITLNTQVTILYLLQNAAGTQRNNCIIHYLEIRNKIRTSDQIADISNRLLLPCFYTVSTEKSYPVLSASDLASAYHEWKFDETSGTIVADSKGTMNGTATGAIIVDSPLGIGKARSFSATITDAVNCGNYSFPAEYTAVLIIKPAAAGRSIIGNFNGSIGNAIQCDLDRTLKFYSNANTPITANSRSTLNIGQNNFVAVSVGGGIADVYINSSNIDVSFPWIPNTSLSSNLQLGNNGVSTDSVNGVFDYALIIPRYLAPAEMLLIYNSLTGVIGNKDIRSILPANVLSLGCVRSDTDSIIEISKDYAVGRREWVANENRRVFLGWKYFNGAMALAWDNPFGTRKVKTYYTWAQDANGTNESDTTQRFDNGSTSYGLIMYANSSKRIRISTSSGGVAYFNGVLQTSGYIGCYAEVIE